MSRQVESTILAPLQGGLIVSCQALPGEPMYAVAGGVMPLFALAAEQAGAVGIRASSTRDVAEIKGAVSLPVIGLIKRTIPGYGPFITPEIEDVISLVEAGADIVAFDATLRPRSDGQSPAEFVDQIRSEVGNVPLMADIATFDEGMSASRTAVDCLSTTLSGYTEQSRSAPVPDLPLVTELSTATPLPVFAEGRIRTPELARAALEAGAFAVVVGAAITRPLEIAAEFMEAIAPSQK